MLFNSNALLYATPYRLPARDNSRAGSQQGGNRATCINRPAVDRRWSQMSEQVLLRAGHPTPLFSPVRNTPYCDGHGML